MVHLSSALITGLSVPSSPRELTGRYHPVYWAQWAALTGGRLAMLTYVTHWSHPGRCGSGSLLLHYWQSTGRFQSLLDSASECASFRWGALCTSGSGACSGGQHLCTTGGWGEGPLDRNGGKRYTPGALCRRVKAKWLQRLIWQSHTTANH